MICNTTGHVGLLDPAAIALVEVMSRADVEPLRPVVEDEL